MQAAAEHARSRAMAAEGQQQRAFQQVRFSSPRRFHSHYLIHFLTILFVVADWAFYEDHKRLLSD
jgi:hypothetical protein